MRLSLFAAILACLALVGCAGPPPAGAPAGDLEPGYPLRATSCGFSSIVRAKPERAVTLNQGATEVALALGVQDRLAGTAYLDDTIPAKWAKAYGSVPVLSPAYPDRETLFAAEPDFVYGSYSSAFDAKVAGSPEGLERAGIASYLSPYGCANRNYRPAVSFDAVWDEVDAVAEVFGVPDRSAEVRKKQQDLIAGVRAAASGRGLRVFWYDSGDRVAGAGAGEGGPQLILDTVGSTNVFVDLKGGWADVSWEKVVESDPDVIVLVNAGWSTARAKEAFLAKDPVLSKLWAVQNRRYVRIAFSESTPGVRLADGALAVSTQLAELRAGW